MNNLEQKPWDDIDLAKSYEEIQQDLIAREEFLEHEHSVGLRTRVGLGMLSPALSINPTMARWVGTKSFDLFVSWIRKNGIEVNLPDNTLVQPGDVVFGNHQIAGIEALAMPWLLPSKSRIVLKSELTDHKVFGKGVKALDPIIFDRNPKKIREAMKFVKNEQRKTLEDGNALGVFAEGTRSEDGSILKFKQGLMEVPLEHIVNTGRGKVFLLVADTFSAIPFKPENAKKDKNSLMLKAPINLHLVELERPTEKDLENVGDYCRYIRGETELILKESVWNQMNRQGLIAA